MKFRAAKKTDLFDIQALLEESQLPSEDCENHLENFLVVELDNDLVGAGGVELYHDIALLRSVVVRTDVRGQGVGAKIFFEVKKYAHRQGVKEFYLLTETAQDYFKNHGFVKISREAAPHSIKQTEQFSGLCSCSATVMKLHLE